MINNKVTILFLISLIGLTACISQEQGSPYVEPDLNTSPGISFGTHYIDSNVSSVVPNYMTIADDSADLTVTFGSQSFTYGAKDMTLFGYGDLAETTEIHRFAVQEDSRGIKAVRQGVYHVTGNNYDEVDFHFLAADGNGDVILTETSALSKVDENQRPFMQTYPNVLFRSDIAVGESWISGATWIPWFYDFSQGWKVTLLDDNATAPISGETGTVLLMYQRESPAFYIYLKEGVGVVEVIWSWERDLDSGRVLPTGGYAYKIVNETGLGPVFQGYGYEYNDVTTGVENTDIASVALSDAANVHKSGDGAYVYSANTTVPANTVGYDSYWIGDEVACSTTSTLKVQLCDLQFLYDDTTAPAKFSYNDFGGFVGTHYEPRISVMYDEEEDGTGAIYTANVSNAGSFSVEPYYGLGEDFGLKTVLITGSVVNEADAADVREIFLLVSLYTVRTDVDEREGYIVFNVDTANALETTTVGVTRRLTWQNIFFGADANVPSLAQSWVEWGTSPAALTNTITNILCTQVNSECGSTYRVAEFTAPADAGLYYYQIVSNAGGGEVRSPVYTMEVKAAALNQTPVARVFHEFPEGIKGSRDNQGNFNVVLSGVQSRDSDGSIYTYGWDFGDGTAFSDSSPLVSHDYTADGEYTVKLTVTDDRGAIHSVSENILVTDLATVKVTDLIQDIISQSYAIYICPTSESVCEIAQYSYFSWKDSNSFEIQPGASGRQYRIVVEDHRKSPVVVLHEETIYISPGDVHDVVLN